MRITHRGLPALVTLGVAATVGLAPLALAPAPASAAGTDLVINEVSSNPGDFVELKNTGDHLVDVSELTVADSDHDPIRITTESTPLLPGELYSFDPDALPGGFGLGSADAVTIYLADGSTVVDSYAWTSHRVPSYGLCEGVEGLIETAVATPGAPNVCQPVRINEIESSGGEPGDWVELVNVTAAPVDLTGWVVKDAEDDHAYTLPATEIAAGAHLVVDEADLDYGLGGADSVRLFGADGSTLVDSYSWTSHAATTYGRCADGTGDLTTTRTPTKGAANDCAPPHHGVDTEPWPGSPDVTLADPQDAFVSEISSGDVSGLAFDPQRTGVLWAVKNKNRLFKLTLVDGLWTPSATDGWAGGKELLFADGGGEPDTEGVTVGPDGAVYATSERDNADKDVARNAVLRYDPDQPGPLTATDEWDLDADFPELDRIEGGSNLGFEGLTWVPDGFLVDGGFIDQSTGSAYDPSDYPGHGDGLFLMALENDGRLYAYALADGTADRVAVVDSGFPHVMDVSFDPERQRVWAVCDDTCDGQVSVLAPGGDGTLEVEAGYDRPAGMPNLNNEGFAIAPQSTCADGSKQVLWSDDAGTGGHSLRAGTLPCEELAGPAPVTNLTAPRITGTARVGLTLSGVAGTWEPAPATTSYQWLADGKAITGATGAKLTVTPNLVGRRIALRVTVSAPGHVAGRQESAATPKVVAARFAIRSTPQVTGSTRVGRQLTVKVGTVTPAPVRTTYSWYVDGRRASTTLSPTVTLPANWRGRNLAVKVTYQSSGFVTATRNTRSVRVLR